VCTADVVEEAKAADWVATARPPVIRAAVDRSAGAPRRIKVLLR
jgi:hypothetical protein